MKNTFLKKISSSLIAGLLVLSFVAAPVSQTLEIKRAEAIPVFDSANLAANVKSFVAEYGTWIETAIGVISDAATAAGIGSMVTKEYILDTIVWGLINLVIKEMIRSVTRWVNSGFQGSPMFIQDLRGFLLNIADKVAGEFIYGAGLGFLCSPFKLNIQFALDLQYGKTRSSFQSQCSLSGVVSNMQGFLKGDFLAGGWDGWSQMALVRQNNPYGAMLEAEAALNISIANAQGQKIEVAKWGSGFLPKDKNGKTVTPGKVVENALNDAISSPNRRLEVADEINELVGALLGQLVGAVLSGAGGLLGLTDDSTPGGSYMSRVMEEGDPQSYEGTGVAGTQASIPDAIQNERSYIALQQTIVARITDASTYKKRTYPDTDTDGDGKIDPNTCHTGSTTMSLSNQLKAAQAEIIATPAIISDLEEIQADLVTLNNNETPTSTIASIIIKYNATSKPDALAKITSEFMTYYNSGKLHTAQKIKQIEMSTDRYLTEEIESFTESIDTACRIDPLRSRNINN